MPYQTDHIYHTTQQPTPTLNTTLPTQLPLVPPAHSFTPPPPLFSFSPPPFCILQVTSPSVHLVRGARPSTWPPCLPPLPSHDKRVGVVWGAWGEDCQGQGMGRNQPDRPVILPILRLLLLLLPITTTATATTTTTTTTHRYIYPSNISTPHIFHILKHIL